ncbi:MAG: hypothetical protein M0O96_09795 [Desulforhopalus sp.]|nr:hypothetical protein [Desulforhopalus sp.]
MKEKIQKNNFDLAGNSHARLIRMVIFAKVMPIGNIAGGPGMRCLAVLSVLYYCGWPLYAFNARYGHHLGRMKGILSRLKNRGRV